MNEEEDRLITLYLIIALIIWMPLGYIIMIYYMGLNNFVLWIFGALGFVSFMIAIVKNFKQSKRFEEKHAK